jgi:hypothetical protein
VDWVLSAYDNIQEATIRKTFLSIGFVMPVDNDDNDDDAVDNHDNDDDSSNDDHDLHEPADDKNESSDDDEIIVRNPQRILEV